jgi:hypothetical protein
LFAYLASSYIFGNNAGFGSGMGCCGFRGRGCCDGCSVGCGCGMSGIASDDVFSDRGSDVNRGGSYDCTGYDHGRSGLSGGSMRGLLHGDRVVHDGVLGCGRELLVVEHVRCGVSTGEGSFVRRGEGLVLRRDLCLLHIGGYVRLCDDLLGHVLVCVLVGLLGRHLDGWDLLGSHLDGRDLAGAVDLIDLRDRAVACPFELGEIQRCLLMVGKFLCHVRS